MTQPILEYRVTEVAANGKHETDTDPDFETLWIESVNGDLPTKKEIVEEHKDERDGDGIIREHVCHHADLVVNGCGRPDKFVKLGGDRAFGEPFNEWIKHELGAAEGIFFLPSGQYTKIPE
jgi:hypothetical protein